MILFHYGESWNLLRADQRLIFAKSWPRASRHCCKVSDEAAFCLIQR
ncbi:integrase, partial [Escherichia coli]